MPRFVEASGLLDCSYAENVAVGSLPAPVRLLLRLFAALRLCRIEPDAKDAKLSRVTNLTLLNSVLIWSGPLREDRLCRRLLLIQATRLWP